MPFEYMYVFLGHLYLMILMKSEKINLTMKKNPTHNVHELQHPLSGLMMIGQSVSTCFSEILVWHDKDPSLLGHKNGNADVYK